MAAEVWEGWMLRRADGWQCGSHFIGVEDGGVISSLGDVARALTVRMYLFWGCHRWSLEFASLQLFSIWTVVSWADPVTSTVGGGFPTAQLSGIWTGIGEQVWFLLLLAGGLPLLQPGNLTLHLGN